MPTAGGAASGSSLTRFTSGSLETISSSVVVASAVAAGAVFINSLRAMVAYDEDGKLNSMTSPR